MSQLPARVPAGLLLVLVLLLTACAAPTSRQEASPVPVIHREIPPAVQPSRALERLLDESRRHYDTGQWQAAIASAERGLRVDRREPELYLLLAKSYNALGERERALEFARQGLRYTPDGGSRVAGALEQMKTTLEYKP